MTRPLRIPLILAVAAVAMAALGFTVSPAAAAEKPACWKVVINDWYDGSIDGKYPLHCYREALAHIGRDVKGYSSAYDDINRALQQRIAAIAAAKRLANTPKGTKPAKTSAKPAQQKPAKRTTTTEASNNGNSNGGGTPPPSSSSGPPSSPPPVGAVPIKHKATDRHSNGGNQTSTAKPHPVKASRSTSSSSTPKPVVVAPVQGRDVNGAGPVQSAIKSLGPGDATSVPIPLLVLAGLAGLLMLIGGASLVAKRAQSRRVATVPVRSTESR